jgi:hypothetical protein
MVLYALLNDVPISATNVDRRTYSTLGVHPDFICIGCKHKLTHCLPTNSVVSPITPYYAHRHGKDCVTCKSCRFFVGNLQVDTTYDRNDLINNDFVKLWQQNFPPYLDAQKGVLYNLGSFRGAITIYDNIRDKYSKNISSSKEPPKLVILNGSRFKLDIVKLNDTHTYWTLLNPKSYIEDIIKRNGTVLLDNGTDHIIRLNSLDVINREDYDCKDTNLHQFYKCDILHIDIIIKQYFPDGYNMTRTNTFDYSIVKMATNNIERKRKERENAELRRIEEEKRIEERKAKEERRIKESKAKELEKRLEERKGKELKCLSEENIKNYTPRKLKNKDEVLELYKNYIDGGYLTSETTQFTWQMAEDGTKFIDITSDNIQDQNIKCVYNTNLLIKIYM